MAEKNSPSEEEKPNLERILDQSTAKASAKVEKDRLIEKQNAEMKRLLRLLPFQVFILVADADGKIDTREVSQFREFLSRREKHCSNNYTRRMFHATVVNYTALTNRFLSDQIKKDFSIVEKALGYVQMCVDQVVMQQICTDLRELAMAIAEASGGFLGVTSRISKEEEGVIEKLDELFDRAIELAGEKDETANQLTLEF